MKLIRLRPVALLLLCLALGAGACTPRPGTTVPGGEASRAWQAFVARSSAVEKGSSPYRISANIRYTVDNESQRVSALLWSNAEAAQPMRLDLLAGGGTVVAKIAEDEQVFTAYIPRDNIAWFHPRGEYALAAFGVPIPLTLHHLGLLLTGRAGQLFLPEGASGFSPATSRATDQGYAFTIKDAPLPGTLEIRPDGTPVSWRDAANEWFITFEPADDSPMRPRRLRISHPKGYEAIVVVNSIEYPDAPFVKEQLTLNLPKTAEYRPIEDAHAGN